MNIAQTFADQGYVVFRNYFPEAEVTAMRDEIERLASDPANEGNLTKGALRFTTNSFKKSPLVQKFLSQQRLIDTIKPITGGDLWVRWDQAVTKKPSAGVFPWHQDNGYNGLKTQHFQIWVALTKSEQQNGALWLAPGSHRRGHLPHTPYDGGHIECLADVGETTCVDATAGDLIIFSSLLLHHTGPNNTQGTRTAYVAEFMPLSDYDFDASGPYFVLARDGRSAPEFVRMRPGALSLKNQLMYWRPQVAKIQKRFQRLTAR